MSDLLTRLRAHGDWDARVGAALCNEAAAEIERLRHERWVYQKSAQYYIEQLLSAEARGEQA